MKPKQKCILTTAFTQKKLSSIISTRTKVTEFQKIWPFFVYIFWQTFNFGSNWDNWAQFFLGESCGQNKLFLWIHKNFYPAQLLRYLAFFLNLNWNLKFWISYIVILIWGLWFTWIWNLYPSVRVQSTVVVSNFLEKFEMATTFLFMAVHIWIFDMLFVYAPKLSGTQ